MKKEHITIKRIRESWDKKFYCGYCDLYYIMKGKEPTYYNSGVYGWNCDIYTDYKRDIAITTGYRNMTGKRIPSELIEKYTKIAKNISENASETNYNYFTNSLKSKKSNSFSNSIDASSPFAFFYLNVYLHAFIIHKPPLVYQI